MFRIIKVSGDSMSPDFNNGDYVLICRLKFFYRLINLDSIIVFNSAEYGTLIKKVIRIDLLNRIYFVSGINKNSLTSETIGAVNTKSIIGFVIFHFRKNDS